MHTHMQTKERGWIEPIVERVVSQALDAYATQLRSEIVRRVVEEIAVEPGASSLVSACSPADLARAVGEIHLGSSQREILRALLDTCARYSSRVALFVVKGSHATGWQARGFSNNDAVKDFALDESAAAVVRALGDRSPTSAPVADLDAHFFEKFGTPASGEATILPLILKDKVAALVYADCGTEPSGSFDAGALELLVLSTSAWLEVNSLRKQAHKEMAPENNSHANESAAPSRQTPPQGAGAAYHDPFAAPAHTQAMAAAASASEVSGPEVSMAAEASPMIAEPQHTATQSEPAFPTAVQTTAFETEPAPIVDPMPLGHAESASSVTSEELHSTLISPEISPEDQDIHRKAQRFARLLVDEIKLYNQAKVVEGRKNRDLYDRLQEVIEKSRAMYQKRYGNSVAASGDYFHHEIIRSLAEDNVSIMGANFRQ